MGQAQLADRVTLSPSPDAVPYSPIIQIPAYMVRASLVPAHPESEKRLYASIQALTDNPITLLNTNCLEGPSPLGQRTTLEVIVSSPEQISAVRELMVRHSGINPPTIHSYAVSQVYAAQRPELVKVG